MSRRSSRATLFVARIETKSLARMRSETLKSRSLGLDMALRAYSTSARFLIRTVLGLKHERPGKLCLAYFCPSAPQICIRRHFVHRLIALYRFRLPLFLEPVLESLAFVLLQDIRC